MSKQNCHGFYLCNGLAKINYVATRSVMNNASFDGLGVWVAFTQKLKDPVLEADEMIRCGFSWVAIRCNGTAEVARLVEPFTKAGLKCLTWHYSYPGKIVDEAKLVTAYSKLPGVVGHLIDAEIEWENTNSLEWRRTQATEFGKRIRNAVGDTYHVGHAPLAWVPYHFPYFPHKEFSLFCDSVHPQAYWTELKHGKYNDDFTKNCVDDWFDGNQTSHLGGQAILPIGVTYGSDSPYAKKAPGKFDARDLEMFLGNGLDVVPDANARMALSGTYSLYSWEAAEPGATNYLKMRKAHLDYLANIAEQKHCLTRVEE